MRNDAREMTSLCESNFHTGEVYDESQLDADLVELGASFDSGVFGSTDSYYGDIRTPKPQRADDSAMPGLGAAGYDQRYEQRLAYVLASRAWMRANCASYGEARRLWLQVLEEYRRGVEPSPELVARAEQHG